MKPLSRHAAVGSFCLLASAVWLGWQANHSIDNATVPIPFFKKDSATTGRESTEMRSAAQSGPPEARTMSAALAAGDTVGADAILAEWLLANSSAVTRWAARPGMGSSLLAIARVWGTLDPVAALAWTRSVPDTAARPELVEQVITSMAGQHPEETYSVAARHIDPQRPSGMHVLNGLAQQWAEKDLNGALARAESLPEGEARDGFLARIAFVQSREHPEDAAILVVERLPWGNIQNEAILSVLHQWAAKDIEAADAWVATFPEDHPVTSRARGEIKGLRDQTDRLSAEANAVP